MKTAILTGLVLIFMLVSLTGCTKYNKNEENTQNVATQNSSVQNETQKSTQRVVDTIDYKTAAENQMKLPEKGETIAIMKIKDFGEVRMKFFEDIAPKAVENFVTHAKEGYYNGLTFHRVIDEFMIQGGDPTATGSGGESIWKTGFGTELDYNIVPYRGSLCMAMSQLPNSIGSQFFITQAHYSEEMEHYLSEGGYPAGLIEQYKNYGGYLSLYLNYTVFGQVYEGMDVIDKVAKVETHTTDDGQEDKPVEDVVIESIEISTY